MRPSRSAVSSLAAAAAFILVLGGPNAPARAGTDSFLDAHLLITWYGNPHSRHMGVLGERTGAARAEALQRQADAFAGVTAKRILPAYHLVAVVAQPTAGADAKYRRRESAAVIQALLDEARVYGYHLVLDIQPGHASVAGEVDALAPFLREPDVHLALDPEFAMSPGQIPGRQIGSMRASEINAAIDRLDAIIIAHQLPRKVLILHQFTLGMLPDKAAIRPGQRVELVLDMDGFGSQSLKQASYRAIMRQRALDFAGIKLFYRQDSTLLKPGDVMALRPVPSVVIFQ